jgi:hypothetical protein
MHYITSEEQNALVPGSLPHSFNTVIEGAIVAAVACPAREPAQKEGQRAPQVSRLSASTSSCTTGHKNHCRSNRLPCRRMRTEEEVNMHWWRAAGWRRTMFEECCCGVACCFTSTARCSWAHPSVSIAANESSHLCQLPSSSSLGGGLICAEDYTCVCQLLSMCMSSSRWNVNMLVKGLRPKLRT